VIILWPNCKVVLSDYIVVVLCIREWRGHQLIGIGWEKQSAARLSLSRYKMQPYIEILVLNIHSSLRTKALTVLKLSFIFINRV
jgi:hypothetical protein